MATHPRAPPSAPCGRRQQPCFLVTMIILSLMHSVNSWTFERLVLPDAARRFKIGSEESPLLDRRAVLQLTSLAVCGSIFMAPNQVIAAGMTITDIGQRLQDDILFQPPVSAGSKIGGREYLLSRFPRGN
jgi:hypothetical protein